MGLDKNKLLNRFEFEEKQEYHWHTKSHDGGFRVYSFKDVPVAIFSNTSFNGYILSDPDNFTGSQEDLIDEFKKIDECTSARMNLLQQLIQETDKDLSYDQILESLQMSRVHVSKLSKKEIPGLKEDVFTIKNESPIIDALISLLGIPRDGFAYKIRTGFMAYDSKNKILFFSKNKYDLPNYMVKEMKTCIFKQMLKLSEAKRDFQPDIDDIIGKEATVMFNFIKGNFGKYFNSVSFKGKVFEVDLTKKTFTLEYERFDMDDGTKFGGPGSKITKYKSSFMIQDIISINEHNNFYTIIMKG